MPFDNVYGSFFGNNLLLSNGYLVCNDPACDKNVNDQPVYWCDYISDILTKGYDTVVWWENDTRRFHTDFVFNVPTFPSFDMWTQILLCPTENFNRYLIRWKPRNHPENSEGDFLTFFSPGESISSVRDVLFEQMYADPEWTVRTCNFPAHTFNAEMRWQSNTQTSDTVESWAQRWCVFYTGMCLECAKNQYTPDDDLVPGAERNVWSPNA